MSGWSLPLDEGAAPLVRGMRERAGLTQRELAERLGTTQPAVSRWERGREEPRWSSLTAIARACGLTGSVVVDDDVDRAQIREHLAMTPADRLRSVANVDRLRTVAHRVA